MQINIRGIDINYTDEGSGVPVLLLHGWGSSCDVWAGVIALLKSNYRCVAPDLPGCGASALPSTPLTTEDYMDIVSDFAAALDLRDPILIGHSHGGRVIINLLANGVMSAKKAVLFGSAGILSKKTLKQRLRTRVFKCARSVLLLPGIRNFSAGPLERLRRHFGSADYNAAPPVMRQTLVNVLSRDYRDILPNIKASCLLIWGENDTATPLWQGRLMEDLIPDSGLCVIKGAGHYSFLERPGEIAAILKSFLL